MEKLLTNLIGTIIGSADNSINVVFNSLIDMCFNSENYLTQILGVEVLNFDSLKQIILGFAISLIVLKFLKKGFDTYISWTEGDNDMPPLNFVGYFVRALVMAISFPIVYDWLISVSKDLATQIMTALNMSEQYSITTYLSVVTLLNLFSGILALIILVMVFLLYIQFIMRGVEMLILKLGFPLACVGLVDSDKGIFAPYMKKFFQSIVTIIVQIALTKLAILLITTTQLLQATAVLLVALRTPRFLSEFMLSTNGGTTGVSSIIHNTSKTIELSKQIKRASKSG